MQVFPPAEVCLFDDQIECQEPATLYTEPPPETKTNRAFYRTVNERLLDENVMGYGEDEVAPYFCECGAAGCVRWIRLSANEFQDWLAEPGSNLVAPGHDDPLDHVVLRTVRYVVVFGSGL